MASSEAGAGTGAVRPSHTALMAAAARAAHLVVDDPPVVFADTLAEALLGDLAGELLSYHRTSGDHPVLATARTQVTVRSRYTEDRLAELVRAGLTQYVVLGAGLDTFAYRDRGTVRVFEVDAPATQEWKRRALAAAGIDPPETLTYVPVDLADGDLAGALAARGFDAARPALVSWLGVVMYLNEDAVGRTVEAVGGFAPGSELVLDYILPPGMRDAAGQYYVDLVAPEASRRGEPWASFFEPDGMSALLARHGLRPVEHLHQRDAVDASLWRRTDPLAPSALSMLARARIPGPAGS